MVFLCQLIVIALVASMGYKSYQIYLYVKFDLDKNSIKSRYVRQKTLLVVLYGFFALFPLGYLMV